MKNAHRALAVAFLGVSIWGSAAGQNYPQGSHTTDQMSNQTNQMMHPTDSKQWQNLHRASKIIGADVKDAQGKKIADIKDIVLDRGRGQVAYAVVSFGGVMGVGRKYYSIPWKALQLSADRDYYVLNVDKDTLAKAPSFDNQHWPDMANAQWSSDIDRYWQSRTSGQGMSGSSSSGQ